MEIYNIRHSLSHLLAMAVLEVFPEAKLAIGPPVDNGFYYDFDLPRSIQPEDLLDLEKRMRNLQRQNLGFSVESVSIAEAKRRLASQPYKLELVEELEAKGETEVTFYTSGSFVDLCKGPHVATTADIPCDAFCLSHAAGAYWRGDEKNKMLQRIYGLAFATKDELDAYKNRLEEAKLRDHRKLGAELDLFTFPELVGSGLPLWTPRGTLLRNLLDDFVWELRQARGYEKVEIPHITKKDLYERSGHWEKFQHELFRITTREGHEFAMKPMNCPHHTQIFDRRKWSYRDLPQRYANTTVCYRDEQTGELNGLSRTRAFAQDDAHVFCRYSRMEEEMLKIWDIIEAFYGSFGFKLRVRLSFHDPANMQSYLGSEEVWNQEEAVLKRLAEARGADYFIGVGEAAFYGPKIDFMAYDALDRQWQVATIQADKNMPDRFGLTYTGEGGQEEPVVMIHAAIMGSIERFMSVLIEHLAGNFPFWLSPTQIQVIPVSEQFNGAAEELAATLRASGLRVQVDTSSESVGKKIRSASLAKVPARMVVGQKELDARQGTEWNMAVNWRADLQAQGEEALPLTAILAQMQQLVAERRLA